MTLLGLLVFLILACLAYWAVTRILSAFGVGDPIRGVIVVILVLLIVLAFVNQIGYGPNLNLRLR